ncbi:CPBP family intramembrane metalloprotease [Paenibacillus psychroresistens]|uniref:CPBP family intramembrane metalloprotease n=1 Tax=Paenibacillus psychroresistens TaxID=1778678 RepID=A0A6B8RH20_9BACL|nr:CPBP family intramembrane glutamic endopeptidase [Paenibacillus psychroresistens]QGQ94842.1 CPBP family intramembrane metalloprotease [Paenibacillus psychroresistens]
MIPHRFNAKLFLLAVIGFILFFGSAQLAAYEKDDSMQPELAKPLVSKAQAIAAATQFLNNKYSALIVTDSSITYESSKALSAYLQKNNLTKSYKIKYNKLIPLDYWQVQIWDELSSTRYIVDVQMDQPRVFGWQTGEVPVLAVDEKADSTSESKARKTAEGFLKQEGYNLSSYEPNPAVINDKEYLLVFEQLKADIGDAKQKLSVRVYANDISAFHISFTIPEQDSSWISNQERYGQIMSLVSLLCMLIFAITALVLSIVRRKLISFSRGWLLTIIFLIISVVGTFNTLPSAGMKLGETNAQVYLIIYLIFTIGVNILLAAAVYFSLVTGVQMWQQQGWNPWPRWKEARFGTDVFYGMGRGYLICIFIIGVQQLLFLIAGKSFHAFAINDPGQSEYNMLWPALFPLLAWMAAISEEIIFRFFGIILFQKLVRFRFLAILIPSVIWALGHTSYSLYPSYTRLIEVTVLGFIFSYTFLRYGLITAIFTHAIMDSLLMGLSLLYSAEDSSYILIGIFYIALPALLAYSIRFLKRRSVPSEAAIP